MDLGRLELGAKPSETNLEVSKTFLTLLSFGLEVQVVASKQDAQRSRCVCVFGFGSVSDKGNRNVWLCSVSEKRTIRRKPRASLSPRFNDASQDGHY